MAQHLNLAGVPATMPGGQRKSCQQAQPRASQLESQGSGLASGFLSGIQARIAARARSAARSLNCDRGDSGWNEDGSLSPRPAESRRPRKAELAADWSLRALRAAATAQRLDDTRQCVAFGEPALPGPRHLTSS